MCTAKCRAGQWSGSGVRSVCVDAGARWAAPLGAAGALWVRPLLRARLPFAPADVDWRAHAATRHAECRAPPDTSYRSVRDALSYFYVCVLIIALK